MNVSFQHLMSVLNRQYEEQLPFIVYRKAGDQRVKAMMLNAPSGDLYSDGKKGFWIRSFDGRDQFFFDEQKSRILESNIEFSNEPLTYNFDSKEVPDDEYRKSFDQINDAIQSGRIRKAVLSRVVEIETHKVHLEQLLSNLFVHYGSAFCSCFYHPKFNFWVGATPEGLIKTHSDRLEIMSLAGTKKMEDDQEWTLKEDEEQSIVTEYIKDCLTNLHFKDISVSHSNRQAENVVHKLTLVSAPRYSFPRNEIQKLIKTLHPTPAVCGVPKQQALDSILNAENHARSFYTGFLGEINDCKEDLDSSEIDLYVHLRCFNWDGQTAKIYVGGGITASSDMNLEWRETEYKSFAMRKLLKISESNTV